jgi:hypothetical protein
MTAQSGLAYFLVHKYSGQRRACSCPLESAGLIQGSKRMLGVYVARRGRE